LNFHLQFTIAPVVL